MPLLLAGPATRPSTDESIGGSRSVPYPTARLPVHTSGPWSSPSGVMVSGSDRLRFWRTPLSEEDREDDDAADGHELALPVLERLEPEDRCGHEFHGADLLTPVSHLLRVVVASTPQGVQGERQNEQERQREPQRVLVQPELPPSTSHRTGRLRQI